jgi:hypothetical protein
MEKVYVYTCLEQWEESPKGERNSDRGGRREMFLLRLAEPMGRASGEREGKKEKCNFIYAWNDPYK